MRDGLPALVGPEAGDEGGSQADDDGDGLDHPADVRDPADEPEDDQPPERFAEHARIRSVEELKDLLTDELADGDEAEQDGTDEDNHLEREEGNPNHRD